MYERGWGRVVLSTYLPQVSTSSTNDFWFSMERLKMLGSGRIEFAASQGTSMRNIDMREKDLALAPFGDYGSGGFLSGLHVNSINMAGQQQYS